MTHDLTRETLEWIAAYEKQTTKTDELASLAHAAECVREVADLRRQVEAHAAYKLALVDALGPVSAEQDGTPLVDAIRAVRAENATLRRQVEVWQAECASMNEEFGLPPTIRPAEGEIRRWMDERKALKSENATLRAKAEIVDAMERGEIRQVRKIATGEIIVYGSDGMHAFRGPTLAAAYAQARAAQTNTSPERNGNNG